MGLTVQEIGYAFLQTYYNRMKKDPSKVSLLYSDTAELTHVNYQVDFTKDPNSIPTVKLTGKDNITKFFTRNNKKVCDLKIKLDTCDVQTTGAAHAGILILTTGEMFWTGTPAFRFCQTIILSPSPEHADTFDVTNDVIRYIPDEIAIDTKPKDETKGEEIEINNDMATTKGEKKQEQTRGNNPVVEEKDSIKLKENAEKPIRKQEKVGNITNVASKKVEKEVTGTPKNESLTITDLEMASEGNSDDGVSTEILPSKDSAEKLADLNTIPPVKMTWASKLANGESKLKVSESTNNVGGAKPESAGHKPANFKKLEENKIEITGGNRKESSYQQKHGNNNNSNSTHNNANVNSSKKKQAFSTVNKDGFYPIYIRGTNGLEKDKLKKVLEREFGTIMRITLGDNFAVADFENQSGQTEAIEKHKIKVNDIEIYLERKTVSKKSSAASNTSASTTAQNNTSRTNRKHYSKKKD